MSKKLSYYVGNLSSEGHKKAKARSEALEKKKGRAETNEQGEKRHEKEEKSFQSAYKKRYNIKK